VVGRSIIDIDKVKRAISKLKSINHLYKAIDLSSVDEAVQKIVETVKSTTTTMIEELTEEDVANFQYYTIRNLDSKTASSTSDIDQYKVNNIKEDPLSNKLKFLDVMCFPTLFPTGEYGEGEDRSVRLFPSEFAKSRLLNKDSRFRKNFAYIFYLLWQKLLREVSSGIFNVMKSTRVDPMSASSLMSTVDRSNEQLEN
jgi:hypothetical protein